MSLGGLAGGGSAATLPQVITTSGTTTGLTILAGAGATGNLWETRDAAGNPIAAEAPIGGIAAFGDMIRASQDIVSLNYIGLDGRTRPPSLAFPPTNSPHRIWGGQGLPASVITFVQSGVGAPLVGDLYWDFSGKRFYTCTVASTLVNSTGSPGTWAAWSDPTLGTAALAASTDFDAAGAGLTQAQAAWNAEPVTIPVAFSQGVVGTFVSNTSAFSPTTQSVPRQFTDGATTSGSANVTSASGAAFVAGDVGSPLYHANLPANTTIASRTSATAVVASANATATGTGLTIAIGSNTAGGEPSKRLAYLGTGAGSVATLMWSFEVPTTATSLDVRLRTTLGGTAGGTGNFLVQPFYAVVADSAFPAGAGTHTQPSAMSGFTAGTLQTQAISAANTTVRTTQWSALTIPSGTRQVLLMTEFPMVNPLWTATTSSLDVLDLRVAAAI